ncbi:beta-N-acetylglucosaminidase [Sphingobacterium sp. CZ-UAM]|uniref:beta-N-acetylhexosaminidase n=1 Tax=Sphingobacterium sp. CZ-UAM TaxID=1933868 RepID=UPI000984BF67|nr:beta-N-acetylhexosaminidase [Sphingobacterium sp. CZ-UAM]OOG16679.1 beta-N-acetylglucosaminidase [Sphingobacterium sp. CZ-UAM]
MKKLFISAILSLIIGQISQAQSIVNIIPKPQEITYGKGVFQLDNLTTISFKNCSVKDVGLFIQQLRQASHYPMIEKKQSSNTIEFILDKKLNVPSDEGYHLDVSAKKVTVKAKTAHGLFNASQSLRQILPSAIEANNETNRETAWSIPAVAIKDYPRYHWRGYMKDVSRTFYSINTVKKYLDVMALYKMNTFHWHLTDDQGWRIEIKKYPKLTAENTTVFHRTEKQPAERSGFYTQDQIKEVIQYAKERNITIVPEIDVPGHSWPTILAYPTLGVNKNSYPNHIFPFVSSWGYWGNQFTPNTLDPTKETTYQFLDDVFTEIAALFPGSYIHFGGDEVRHDLWEKEPHVQEFMKQHQITDVKALQSYFVQRVSAIIVQKGKKPIGWNDILADAKNLPKNTAIMSWLGEEAIKEATKDGFKAVATPASHLYFDITQADRNDGTMTDLAYPQINSLERVYNFDPSNGLTALEDQLLLGVQGNMWSALAQDVKDMNVQNFPRLLAVAEIGWAAKSNKDYVEFCRRLEANLPRLDSMRIDYYHPGGYIAGTWTSNDIREEYGTLTFDVTKKVYDNGRAQAGFFFTEGKNFLEIDAVQLLQDGHIIDEDGHHALADKFRGTNKVKPFYYNFTVKDYNPNAKYEIKARVRGAGGVDSKGNFTFNLSPTLPFSKTEKR